jgi:hypothetical protein
MCLLLRIMQLLSIIKATHLIRHLLTSTSLEVYNLKGHGYS